MLAHRIPHLYTYKHKRPNQRAHTRHYALLDDAVCAFAGKVVANTATYPLETIRLLSLCDISPRQPASYPHLMTGYGTYLPYCMASSMITYKTLYVSMAAIPLGFEASLFLGALMTAVATSFYKIPYSYFLKNRILGEAIDYRQLYKMGRYTKAFVATVAEDGPELFIKFFFNNMLASSFPWLGPVVGSFCVAVVTAVALCPVEFWKTSVLCQTKKMHLTPQSIAIRIAMSIINMFTFFLVFDALRSLA